MLVSTDTRRVIQRWKAVFVFFVIHQVEEVVLSLPAWRAHVTLPGWAAFTDHSLMYALPSRSVTALFVAGQCLLLASLAYLLRASDRATRLAQSALLLVLMVAFAVHIALSVATHTVMPGVFTSVFPGLPVGGYLLYTRWRNA